MPNERWARGIILAAATLWVIFVLVAGGQVDFGWYRWLGASISIIVYGLWFFDRWAWRWRGVRRLHRRPVLHGTWRIVLRTDYAERAEDEIEAYLAVTQTFTTVFVCLMTDRARSGSLGAELVSEKDGQILYYIFRVEPSILGRVGNETRRGGTALRVIRRPKIQMEGEYWTEVGTNGEIRTDGHSKTVFESWETARAGTYR